VPSPWQIQIQARTRAAFRRARAILPAILLLPAAHLFAAAAQPAASPAASPSPAAEPPQQFYIREYRVLGAKHLKPVEVESAVYPFLGPGRTLEDVEQARQALLKAYQDKSYNSVEVVVPPQKGAGGIVFLQVNELTVGRLRVEGSRYFDIEHIKRQIPSMAEGQLIDFAQAQKELMGLNQLPDRRITPSVQPGVVPGTMDVDLMVKDTPPLHGSVELNNRYSTGTPALRLNGSLSYNNLWQLGHSIGGSFQLSPQNLSAPAEVDLSVSKSHSVQVSHKGSVKIYTGFYTLRFPSWDWFSLTGQFTEQDTGVSTIGALDTIGKGQIGGLHADIRLPTLGDDYFHHFTFGLDYKHLTQNIFQLGTLIPFGTTPTNYLPITLEYSGTRVAKGSLTDLDLQLVYNLRGIGSDSTAFDETRFNADRNFFYLRGDIADTQDLPDDFQIFGKITGQVADSPLIPSEQFSIGGLDTVRGYLESSEIGDDGLVGNFEFRLPSFLGWIKGTGNECRVYGFADGGLAYLQDTLPQQVGRFYLASFGIGSRLELASHFNASVDIGFPVVSTPGNPAGHPFVTFRVWADF